MRYKQSEKQFSAELIKEYGEQVFRDNLRNKRGFDHCADISVEVAAAVYYIGDSEAIKEAFKKKIIEFAENFKPPIGWN